MDTIDFIVILLSIAGLVLPRVLAKFFVELLAFMTLAIMFLVSYLGGYLLHLYFAQDIGTIFVRVFIVMGISNVVFVSGQVELYQRMGLTRKMIEEAANKRKNGSEKEH
jgi:predicted membrane channel-forming protein YqfA (hemolysin III family)